MDSKFIGGLALGMIAGALLFDSSKDVKNLVEKGKQAVADKVENLKSKKD